VQAVLGSLELDPFRLRKFRKNLVADSKEIGIFVLPRVCALMRQQVSVVYGKSKFGPGFLAKEGFRMTAWFFLYVVANQFLCTLVLELGVYRAEFFFRERYLAHCKRPREALDCRDICY